MPTTVVIFFFLVVSVFFRYNYRDMEISWWESHIPALAVIAVLLSVFLFYKRYETSRKEVFASNMLALAMVGVFGIFIQDVTISSIYAMCISLSMPAIIYFIDNENKYIRIFLVVVFAVCFIAVARSLSRTGIIAMSLSGIYLLHRIFMLRKRTTVAICMVLFTLLLFSMFYIKRDSSDGRIFILENTARMIKEKPLGWGAGGFEANYMLVQAEYFKNNTDEEVAMLADDIKHPLNEYMYIAVNYGVHVTLLLAGIIVFAIYRLYKDASKEGRCCMHFILLLLLWCTFSCPLSVSFTTVMLLAFVPAFGSIGRLFSRRAVRIASITILLPSLAIEAKSFNDDRVWNKAIQEYKYGDKANAMKIFDKYKEYSIDKGAMLFSLATIKYNNKEYKECIKTCNECKNHIASYDLEFMLGNSYLFTGEHQKALEHFSVAHYMCPNRFIPLYKQFKIYKEIGDTANMKSIGNEILAKKIKIPSHKIDVIINNVEYELMNIVK